MDSPETTNQLIAGFDFVGAAAVLAAYIVGSVPFGLVLAKSIYKVDIRQSGSGNIGATNVARVVGKKFGALTLVLDALKGVVPLLVAGFIGVSGIYLGAVGVAAVAGHCFSVYLKFGGGKGVATGLGVFFMLTPLSGAVGALGYVLAFAITRTSSLGSFTLLTATLLTSAFTAPPYWPLVAEGLIGAIILTRHRENIVRLLKGKESKL